MSEVIKILLVEDDLGDAELIQEIFQEEKTARFEITHVDRVSEAIKLLEENDFDLVLLDLSLPDSTGIDTFRKVQLKTTDLPIVLLTELDNETLALKLVQEGAQDYLVKGQINSKVLIKSIRYAIERHSKNKVVKSKLAEYTITESEKEILTLVAEGKSHKEIAEKLHLSLSTIKNHMGKIFAKLRVSNRS